MKLLSKVLAFVLIISCLQFPIASATTDFNSNTAPSVDVTLEEFINNREYYRSLAKEGYIIYIDNEGKSISNLIFSPPQSIDELVSRSSARSIYIPTSYWNVATQGARAIKGATSSETLYSSVQYYGCTSYEVCVENQDPTAVTFDTIGAKTDYRCLVMPYKTAYLDVETTSTSRDDAFYLAFYAPCYVTGYVGPGTN